MRTSNICLNEIRKRVEKCKKCKIWKLRKRVVVGEGPVPCKVIFIGQNPGKTENEIGRPFVGRAGKFLNKLLKNIGIKREKVFLTGAVNCPTPNNRAPTKEEIKNCKEFLELTLKCVNPSLIVAMGNTALKALEINEKVKSLHGKLLEKNNRKIFVTFHPAAAMRFPKIRKLTEKDFKKLKRVMEEITL